MRCRMMAATLLLTVCIGVSSGQARYGDGFGWWNQIHNWDGHTHWREYLTLSPAYMGPNALPVPEIRSGCFQEMPFAEMRADVHFNRGDQTQNLFTRIFVPLARNKAAFEISLVPWELYKMDTVTRDLRAAREYDGEGRCGGDFYFSTFIQIVQDKKGWPDIMASVNLKTASGTKVSSARYTDTPGYYLDLSFGKRLPLASEGRIQNIRPFFMLGLYTWHLYDDRNFQNDAFLFGAGLDIATRTLVFQNQFGGYRGYIDDGDRPLVCRFTVSGVPERLLVPKITGQLGFSDFPYHSVMVGLVVNISKLRSAQLYPLQ